MIPAMNRSRRFAVLFSILAAAGFLFAGWIGSLKAFPAPLFIPSAPGFNMEALENSVYVNESKEKLASGVANVLVGWTDLIAEPERAWENDESVLKALKKGLLDTFANTAGGLLRIFTFPLTRLQIPLPEDGVQL